ncbi:hypothetical protein [uncultured Litoreibacter sp.]|uniref:hypothetical protein n=1 Tax=uncultured Litoreibacter sp. TaxID=1392394 RepID=UPI00260C0DBC|nr:hypothetical protein [uncultured Litoreibacter sp.]
MGKSGAFRARALDSSQMSAMETHENRADYVARLRVVRDVRALIYSPYSEHPLPDDPECSAVDHIAVRNPNLHLSISEACDRHVAGARTNKAAKKRCLHAIVQFPTDLEIDDQTEREMLTEAVAFVNKLHGGQAVFHARLDRDEAGQHAVDVFYAPRYEKLTKRGSTTWTSLTKFGKALAVDAFGYKVKEIKNKETGEREAVLDADGEPIMVPCDSQANQGRALQQAWFEHLRDEMRLEWVVRGSAKIGSDPDRLKVEEHKLKKDQMKLAEERATVAAERKQVEERLEVAGRVDAAIVLLSENEAPDPTSMFIKDEATKKCFDAVPCPLWSDEDGSLGPMQEYYDYAVEQTEMMQVLHADKRGSDWDVDIPENLTIFGAAQWWQDFEAWWSRKLEVFFVGEDGESGFRQSLKRAVGKRHWNKPERNRVPSTRHISHIFEPIRDLRRAVFKELKAKILPQVGAARDFLVALNSEMPKRPK